MLSSNPHKIIFLICTHTVGKKLIYYLEAGGGGVFCLPSFEEAFKLIVEVNILPVLIHPGFEVIGH